jgi:apolipoprotein N-acyltransferase
MLAGLIFDLRSRARLAARAAAFTVAGVVFAMTGLAFLTVALWLGLAQYQSALFASAIVGAMYLVLGVVFFLLAGKKRLRAQHGVHPAPITGQPPVAGQYDPFFRMAEGFAVGMAAGRAARRPR